MRARLAVAALPLLAACAAPLRAADRAQAVPGRPDAARADVAGVTVELTPEEGRGWLGLVPPGLMPVVATLRNGSGGPIRVRPGEFVLVLPDGARREAMEPGRVIGVLRARSPELVPLPTTPPLPTLASGTDRLAWALLYAWPELHGIGTISLREELRPDPRPSPRGLLQDGLAASVVLFFDVDASALRSLAIEVAVEGEGGEEVGKASLPFAR